MFDRISVKFATGYSRRALFLIDAPKWRECIGSLLSIDVMCTCVSCIIENQSGFVATLQTILNAVTVCMSNVQMNRCLFCCRFLFRILFLLKFVASLTKWPKTKKKITIFMNILEWTNRKSKKLSMIDVWMRMWFVTDLLLVLVNVIFACRPVSKSILRSHTMCKAKTNANQQIYAIDGNLLLFRCFFFYCCCQWDYF